MIGDYNLTKVTVRRYKSSISFLETITLPTEMPVYPILQTDFTITSDKGNELGYPNVHENFLRSKEVLGACGKLLTPFMEVMTNGS